ncbi:hypothetical protein BC936DRAFT_144968 [Jimgerdemannia flammicorona]|uniref:Uncharacterized protein n=1 Tax=Jimgerdemannia flammicorona TaxID=994334 RepID=A0A433DB79_9FUNG|nr:hypothetical protein BC936DRAFT_144968 [Jimgerdemannia flammicorona]
MVDFIELLKSGGDETETAYDPSTYFQFKEEKDWDDGLGGMEGDGADELYASLMQIRFDDLETSLAKVPLHVRLGLDERDLAMVTDDFYSDNNLLSAPIVPKFVRSEALLVKKAGDGGAAGSATTSSANPSPVSKTVTSAPGPPTRVLRIVSAGGRATKDADDDLDELLALGDDKPTASPASFSRIPPTSNAAISKPSATAQKAKSRGTDANDFDQFMDEIDGKGGAKTSSAKPASSAAPPRKLKPLARPTPREGHVGLGATAAAPPPPKGGKGGDGMEDWLDDVLGNA